MSNCGLPGCTKPMKNNAFKLSCDKCNKLFHGSCVNMTKTDLESLYNEDLAWHCKVCKSEQQNSIRLESDNVTLGDIMKELQAIKKEQKTTKLEFNNSYELLFAKIDDANKLLEKQESKLNEYAEKMEKLEEENRSLKKQVFNLQTKVDDAEQYSRKNCIDIHGIPQERDESIIEIVKEIGKAIDFEIQENMIDNCHRLPSRRENLPPTIIVKFVRNIDKEQFLRKKRYKKKLSTRHMGMDIDQEVYINESLAPERRKLFMDARRMKKTKEYKYLWTRGGKIFMRKDDSETSRVIHINHIDDLNSLK